MIDRIGDWLYLNMPRPDEQPWLFALSIVVAALALIGAMNAWIRYANGEK